MGVLYVAALIVGLGIVLLQLLLSSADDGEVSADDGEVSADDGELDADAHGHDGAHGHGDHGHDAHADGASDFLAIFLSIRFWTFGALAFGLLGTLLHYLNLAAPPVIAVLASVAGVSGGALASWAFRLLARTSQGSGGETHDLLGQVGKVLVPVERGHRGKVRVHVRGQTLDYLATTDDEALQAGDSVLVEEVRGEAVHVSKAPKELGP